MSIKRSRNFKTFIANGEDFIGNYNASPYAVISFSHLKHVNGVLFFKTKKRNEKLAHLSEKKSCEFNAVKCSSRGFFPVNDFNSTEYFYKFIDECFVDTLNLEFKHILSQARSSGFSSFANEKTPITIDKTSEIYKILSSNFREIKGFATFTHKHLHFDYTLMVQYNGVDVHRERLSEKTSLEDAIVCSTQ